MRSGGAGVAAVRAHGHRQASTYLFRTTIPGRFKVPMEGERPGIGFRGIHQPELTAEGAVVSESELDVMGHAYPDVPEVRIPPMTDNSGFTAGIHEATQGGMTAWRQAVLLIIGRCLALSRLSQQRPQTRATTVLRLQWQAPVVADAAETESPLRCRKYLSQAPTRRNPAFLLC